MDRPPMFEAKKWTLVTVCTIYIIMEIIFAALAGHIADAWIGNDRNIRNFYYQENIKFERNYIIITVIVTSVIAILFQLMGLVGAIREHLCMTTTFVVLHFLSTIGSFIEALKNRAMWAEFAWCMVITLIGVLYVRDLVVIRRRSTNQQYA